MSDKIRVVNHNLRLRKTAVKRHKKGFKIQFYKTKRGFKVMNFLDELRKILIIQIKYAIDIEDVQARKLANRIVDNLKTELAGRHFYIPTRRAELLKIRRQQIVAAIQEGKDDDHIRQFFGLSQCWLAKLKKHVLTTI